jgi:hypothetical protein
MKLGLLSLGFVVALSASAVTARAAEPGAAPNKSDEPAPSPRLALAAGLGGAEIKTHHGYEPYRPAYIFQLEGGYRWSRWWSFGGIASYANEFESRTNHWRGSGQARFHYAHMRAFDAWAGGEVGVAIVKQLTERCGDCAPSPEEEKTRLAPLAGLGLGFDLLPTHYISLGMESRAIMTAFGGGDANKPAGPMFVTMLTIGANIPLAE